MKSPLAERPIFHQVQRRVETQIFLCVLAQYLLVAIENTRLDQGVHTSWASVRDSLATHHIVTIVLPTDTGATLRIRKGSTPESEHQRTLSTARRQRTNRAAEEIWSETGASPVHPPQLRNFTRANESFASSPQYWEYTKARETVYPPSCIRASGNGLGAIGMRDCSGTYRKGGRTPPMPERLLELNLS